MNRCGVFGSSRGGSGVGSGVGTGVGAGVTTGGTGIPAGSSAVGAGMGSVVGAGAKTSAVTAGCEKISTVGAGVSVLGVGSGGSVFLSFEQAHSMSAIQAIMKTVRIFFLLFIERTPNDRSSVYLRSFVFIVLVL